MIPSKTRSTAFRRLASAATAVLAAAAPVAARAAGTDIPEQGAVGAARGGAFTADASDATAIYYNPAGLAQRPGFHFALDASLLNHRVEFTRRNPPNPDGSPRRGEAKTSNTAGWFLLPMLAFAYGWTVADHPVGVALGAHGPSAVGRYNFPADYTRYYAAGDIYSQPRCGPGAPEPPACDPEPPTPDGAGRYPSDPRRFAPQRYTLIKNDLLVLYPTLSVAAELLRRTEERPLWVHGGASLQYVVSHLQFSQALFDGVPLMFPDTNGPVTMAEEDPGLDTVVSINASGRPTITGNLGVLAGWSDRVQVGAYLRPGYRLFANGTLKLQLSRLAQGLKTVVNGDQMGLALNFPLIFRFGVLVRPLSGLSVEADFVVEGWSALRDITLTPRDITVDVGGAGNPQPVKEILVEKHLRDAISMRLGAQYAFTLGVPVKLRAGILYDGGAVPEESVGVDFANFERVFLSAGLGVTLFGRVDLDLAFAYALPVVRKVAKSKVTMGHSNADLEPSVVALGDYESSVTHLAVGVHGHFGD